MVELKLLEGQEHPIRKVEWKKSEIVGISFCSMDASSSGDLCCG